MAWSTNADNGGGGDPAVWDRCRGLWKQNGIAEFPWLHCRSMADVERLISVAEQYNSPAIGLNIENVVGDGLSLQQVSGTVLDFWVNPHGGQVHLPTLDWVQNGQGWQWLDYAVFALEFFPGEGNMRPTYSTVTAHQCIAHAQAEGAKKITAMFKTKNLSPATYTPDYTICHSLFTADDIDPTAPAWNAWIAPVPCTRLESVPTVPLTPKQVPYTGPYYGPANSKGPNKGPTAKALKRGMLRMGFFDGDLGSLDGHYNAKLENAMKRFQRTLTDVAATGQYGKGSWDGIRSARVPAERPHAGEYALDEVAQELIREEHAADVVVDSPQTKLRNALTDYCLKAEANEGKWTYTQRRPYTGLGVEPEKAHANDCSSYVILAYHWARLQTGILTPDPSGYGYSGYGNTWDNLDGHERASGGYLVGDLAHYDGHVTICRKAGSFLTAMWSSFGREAGPEPEPLHYRDDLRFVVRPPLLP